MNEIGDNKQQLQKRGVLHYLLEEKHWIIAKVTQWRQNK